MTRIACRRETFVNAARVALLAGDGGMRSGERECRLRRVIEYSSAPVDGAVAQRTVERESGGGVSRIVGSLIVLQMAGVASRAEAFVNTARMALQTGGRSVLPGKREGGLRGVIKRRAAPVCGGVAQLAVLREPGRGVRRIIC